MNLHEIDLSNDLSAIGWALIMLDTKQEVIIDAIYVSDVESVSETVASILDDNQVAYTSKEVNRDGSIKISVLP